LFFTVTLFLSAHINLTLYIRYYVNRDTLFSYHKASEVFLQRLMALYVASHYKVIACFGIMFEGLNSILSHLKRCF